VVPGPKGPDGSGFERPSPREKDVSAGTLSCVAGKHARYHTHAGKTSGSRCRPRSMPGLGPGEPARVSPRQKAREAPRSSADTRPEISLPPQ
jgi:hypothetical protein